MACFNNQLKIQLLMLTHSCENAVHIFQNGERSVISIFYFGWLQNIWRESAPSFSTMSVGLQSLNVVVQVSKKSKSCY